MAKFGLGNGICTRFGLEKGLYPTLEEPLYIRVGQIESFLWFFKRSVKWRDAIYAKRLVLNDTWMHFRLGKPAEYHQSSTHSQRGHGKYGAKGILCKQGEGSKLEKVIAQNPGQFIYFNNLKNSNCIFLLTAYRQAHPLRRIRIQVCHKCLHFQYLEERHVSRLRQHQ